MSDPSSWHRPHTSSRAVDTQLGVFSRLQTQLLGSFSAVLEASAGGESTRSASGGAGAPMPPDLDWELDGGNLELCRRDDGSPWQLGQGSFGTVRGGSAMPLAL